VNVSAELICLFYGFNLIVFNVNGLGQGRLWNGRLRFLRRIVHSKLFQPLVCKLGINVFFYSNWKFSVKSVRKKVDSTLILFCIFFLQAKEFLLFLFLLILYLLYGFEKTTQTTRRIFSRDFLRRNRLFLRLLPHFLRFSKLTDVRQSVWGNIIQVTQLLQRLLWADAMVVDFSLLRHVDT